MDGMIAEAARRGQVDLSLVSVDSTVARAHHDAAGMAVREEVLAAEWTQRRRHRGDRGCSRRQRLIGETRLHDDLIGSLARRTK